MGEPRVQEAVEAAQLVQMAMEAMGSLRHENAEAKEQILSLQRSLAEQASGLARQAAEIAAVREHQGRVEVVKMEAPTEAPNLAGGGAHMLTPHPADPAPRARSPSTPGSTGKWQPAQQPETFASSSSGRVTPSPRAAIRAVSLLRPASASPRVAPNRPRNARIRQPAPPPLPEEMDPKSDASVPMYIP